MVTQVSPWWMKSLESTTVFSSDFQLAWTCKENGAQDGAQSNVSRLLTAPCPLTCVDSFIHVLIRYLLSTYIRGIRQYSRFCEYTWEQDKVPAFEECAVWYKDLAVCRTCWSSFEKLASHHSFPALAVMPLLELDVRREVAVEGGRGN